MNFVAKPWFIPIVLSILIIVGSQFYTSHVLSQNESMTELEVEKQLETMYFGSEVDQITRVDSRYEAFMTRGDSQYKATVDAKTGKVLTLIQTKKENLALIEIEDKSDNMKKEEETPVEPPSTETPPTTKKQVIEKATTDKPVIEKAVAVKPKAEVIKTPTSVPGKSTVTKNENVKSIKPTAPAKTVKKTVHISEQQAVKIALGQLNGKVDDVDFIDTKEGGYYLVEINIDVDDGPNEATYQIHAISGKVMTVTWDD